MKARRGKKGGCHAIECIGGHAGGTGAGVR